MPCHCRVCRSQAYSVSWSLLKEGVPRSFVRVHVMFRVSFFRSYIQVIARGYRGVARSVDQVLVPADPLRIHHLWDETMVQRVLLQSRFDSVGYPSTRSQVSALQTSVSTYQSSSPPSGRGARRDSSAIQRNLSSSGSSIPSIIACSRTLEIHAVRQIHRDWCHSSCWHVLGTAAVPMALDRCPRGNQLQQERARAVRGMSWT